MKCIYYVAPTPEDSKRVADDLCITGMDDLLLNVIGKKESGLSQQKIGSSSYIETLELACTALLGASLGLWVALSIVGLLMLFEPFGSQPPFEIYIAIIAVTTLFGIWEGGLFGVARENFKLTEFHDELEAGKHLILIYTPGIREREVKKAMQERHPSVRLAAEDAHFINPLCRLKRVTCT
ncbi:hypothetical protein MNKW57_12590 [Biformimicrobium ophioploci]|uniref:Uncharacterized protein n=2 Tax=Biformimicrobium ophioploci TaxID=3036711 RepID=A0ABQ6LXX1_9GAMM|nr:hypothetical protein MNKW57_12590 [Microbulbifer sp. NKW57]